MGAFIDGFEQLEGDPTELGAYAGYTGAQLSSAEGRIPGSVALLISEGSISREMAVTQDVVSFGAAVRFTGRGTYFLGTPLATVEADPTDGMLRFGTAQGQVLPAKAKFYYYEIEHDWGAEESRLYVNGKLDATTPLSTPRPSTLEISLKAPLIPSSWGGEARPSPVSFDDFYYHDGPRLGPIEITTQFADIDDSPQQWEPSVADETHSAIVGTESPEPLDRYVQSGTTGAVDQYRSTRSADRNDEVKAVSIIALTRATTRTDQYLIVASGALSADADPLTLKYEYRHVPVDYAPGTLADTVTGQTLGIEVGSP